MFLSKASFSRSSRHLRKFLLKQNSNLTVQRNHSYQSLKENSNEKLDLKNSENTERSLSSKIIFNSVLDGELSIETDKKLKRLADSLKTERTKKLEDSGLPLFFKYLVNEETPKPEVESDNIKPPVHFPYQAESLNLDLEAPEDTTKKESLRKRQKEKKILAGTLTNWLQSFVDEEEMRCSISLPDEMMYGSCNKEIKVSKVPCGGCGALLHCQDQSIPGFIPQESFVDLSDAQLRSVVCQRCHFLKEFDVALGLNVSPDDYPKILSQIRDKRALVLLMIDLLDFPCGIWPNILDIIGIYRPVIVVGNKVDCLFQDGPKFITQVQESLKRSLIDSGISEANIKDIIITSAKSGYSLENLVSRINFHWKNQGDIYIIGCTNAGKSTLFNALIQSDLCKVQAVDLIKRATVSAWPGTTLNLLKFPILQLPEWKLALRLRRVKAMQQDFKALEEARAMTMAATRYTKQVHLSGFLGRTFAQETKKNTGEDPFQVRIDANPTAIKPFGIDEKDEVFLHSKWCYDTPGVVQPHQIINLLTTEELKIVLPKEVILPRNFHLTPGTSLFIGGLGRFDYLSGPVKCWFTVFASKYLPLTVVNTIDADSVYQELLGSDLFVAPKGGKERLEKWPTLASKKLEVYGTAPNSAAADVLVSSAGWVTVTLGTAERCFVEVWTPQAKGIFVRKPSIYVKTAPFKGKRIGNTPAFKSNVTELNV